MENQAKTKWKLNIDIVKKMIKNMIIFIGLIFVTFWILFKDQDMNQLFDIIRSANLSFILIGVLLMFLYFLMESINIRSILKVLGEKISLFSALKFTLIGFFFSSITPAATGGQPIEIYYMTKEKISIPNATITLLIQLCCFLISTILLGIICAIINPTVLEGGIFWLFLYGVIISSCGLTLMTVCVFSKRLTKKLVNIFIKILTFFKVKNIEERKNKLEEGLNKYIESSKFIKTHKIEFIKSVLRVFIQVCLFYSITFLVYKAFGLNSHNYIQIFTIQAILYSTVSGIPLPGAIGASEAVFLNIYGVAFGIELLNGAMLLSRGITFYLFVIISLIVVILNAFIMRNVKGKIDEETKDENL